MKTVIEWHDANVDLPEPNEMCLIINRNIPDYILSQTVYFNKELNLWKSHEGHFKNSDILWVYKKDLKLI